MSFEMSDPILGHGLPIMGSLHSKSGVGKVVLPLLRSKCAREPSGAQIERIEASEQLSAPELL